MPIKVAIDRKGKATVEAAGYTGTSCEQATAAIREAIGMETDSENKGEYYENEEHEGA